MFCLYLTPTSRNPETPDKSWYAETRGSLRCGGCGKFPGRKALTDVRIQGRGLSDKSDLNFVFGVICFARRRFLNEVIPEDLRSSFYFGKLFDSEGVECTEVATYMAPKVVTVRGNERSTFRVCDLCGRVLYSAIGKKYVLRRDIGDAVIAEDQGGCLVTRVNLDPILHTKWKNVAVQRLPIKDEPVDGLDVPIFA